MANSDVLIRMKADTSGYDANIAKARRQLDQFKKDNLSMGGVIRQLNGSLLSAAAGFASVTAAVGAFSAAVKSNIATAAGFEKSMSQLSSLTGMVGSDLEKLKGYAIELGSSTTLSASQVADAFKMIGSQQPQLLSSGEALKAVTKNAITLAEAAGIELADAAKTLSVSINQMGGDSNNAERYINVLAAAAQKGAGDIVWLGEAITKSGTTAKAVGTDYEELVANLEQLAKAGYDASTAGTALRSIIMNLEKQANQQYKPSVVGLTEAFKNLGEANLTLTEYQGIAGKMFAAQAKALADAAGEAKNMKEEITGTNIAEEQAKTNTDNLDGSLKSLASAWEGLNLHINDSNGFLRTCVDWLKDVVVWADQAFTSAGRAQRQLLAMQGGGNGQPTTVDKQIAQLNSDNHTTNWSTYRGQVAGYNKQINELRDIASKWHEWQNGTISAESKKILDEYRNNNRNASLKWLEQTAGNLEKMRDEYMSRALEIIKPKKTTTETPTPTPGSGGGSDKNKNKNTKKEVEVVSGSIGDYSKQIQELQKAQALVTDPTQWQAYQQAIDGVNEKITILKGILPKDSRAEFRFETITDDVMAKLREVEGVHISTKPVTITADTSEAMDALKNVEGIHIDPKTLVITADNADALEKAKAINGVTVDDKTLRIVADTSEAMDALKNVEGIHIDPKTLVITADNADALEKAKAINGVTVDNKTLRIVADTSEAMQQVQQLTSSIENQEVVIRPTVAFAKELPSLPTLVPKIEMPKMPDIKPLKMQIKAELDAQALKADEQTLNTILKDSIQNGINGMDLQFASLNDQIAKGIDVPDEKWQKILDDYNKLREAIGKDPISIDFSTGNAKKDDEKKGESDFDKGLGDMSKVVSGLSSVASGLQQMGIELPEGVQKTLGVIQGLMSVIQGVNTIISVFSTTSETANTAAVTGNTFAMTALTAAVAANTAALGTNTVTNFIPFFAHGGLVHAATGYMVPGNDHADRTLIAASSGELILNRAQQGVIAGELEGGAGRSVHVTGMLRGEDIVLVADRWGRRTGKGELAFWK